ncbi:MAG TPA: 2-oxoacid ferredoxin oxidoreductase, partial [Elusimicrobia bacterium]|nr:2-oxoacid ferredoxin oxidoreductase [Elusimicrobiota bacterium]
GFAGDLDFLAEIIAAGIKHRGFALIDIIQPCVTFGVHQTPWYKDKIYRLQNDHNPGDRDAALKKAAATGDKIATGIFYINNKPIFPEKEINLTENFGTDKKVLTELEKSFS